MLFIMNLMTKKELINIFLFILLTWIYKHCADEDIFGRTCDKEWKHDICLFLVSKRLLSNHEQVYELNDTIHPTKIRNKGNDYKLMNDKISYPIYNRMKRGTTNYLEVYKKKYKKRYRKKNRLAKLDCYCERKIFDIIGKVETLAENMHNNRKSLKRVIYKRLCLPLFLISLIPFCGLIYPLFFNAIFGGTMCYSDCTKHESGKSHHNKYPKSNISKAEWNEIEILNKVIIFSLIIIVLLILIYLLIKVIKYEKLKSGKGKMNIKEYCHFCKDIFI
ncbi:hypothetical protein PVBG_06312 [Plasmodium vivax Brazil I]|uniref:Variable surface protein n=1 Tax=Plasmodium vivax (strain Brazil I) TaxID=1033975 RepID=A0A0J9SU27_PLAV1|nr:hypothetical protein PVBG_06312 [Plasmodium vivax Brazil I]